MVKAILGAFVMAAVLAASALPASADGPLVSVGDIAPAASLATGEVNTDAPVSIPVDAPVSVPVDADAPVNAPVDVQAAASCNAVSLLEQAGAACSPR